MWHNVKNVTKQRLADVILTYIDTLYKRNSAGKYPNPIKNRRTYSRFQIGNSNPKAESGDHNRCRLCCAFQIKIRRSKQAQTLRCAPPISKSGVPSKGRLCCAPPYDKNCRNRLFALSAVVLYFLY